MNCSECKYSKTIPGDCHLSCNVINEHVGFEKLSSIQKVNLTTICVLNKAELFESKNILEIDTHGFRKGWADWPLNFDPIWINYCKLFQNK